MFDSGPGEVRSDEGGDATASTPQDTVGRTHEEQGHANEDHPSLGRPGLPVGAGGLAGRGLEVALSPPLTE